MGARVVAKETSKDIHPKRDYSDWKTGDYVRELRKLISQELWATFRLPTTPHDIKKRDEETAAYELKLKETAAKHVTIDDLAAVLHTTPHLGQEETYDRATHQKMVDLERQGLNSNREKLSLTPEAGLYDAKEKDKCDFIITELMAEYGRDTAGVPLPLSAVLEKITDLAADPAFKQKLHTLKARADAKWPVTYKWGGEKGGAIIHSP